MQPEDASNEFDFPSSKEMEGWLQREIADATKAVELRVKDAKRLVGAYSRGEISKEEAAELAHRYSSRWGDALPGVLRSEGLTDEEILRRIDEARTKKRPIDNLSGRRGSPETSR
jgi:hypothetical protein